MSAPLLDESPKAYGIRDLKISFGEKIIQTIFSIKPQALYVHYACLENPDAPGELAWDQYGLKRDYRVLFVTTNKRRLQNLWDSLHTIPGFELWAMTTFGELKT